MALNPDNPTTLKSMAAHVLYLADQAGVEHEVFSHIADVCFACDQLAERPVFDQERQDAVEGLRYIIVNFLE